MNSVIYGPFVTMEREESEGKLITVADWKPQKSTFVCIMEEAAELFKG